MTSIVEPMLRFYNWANYYMTDPRSQHLPTLMSPCTVILFLIFYNYFCLSLGRKLMQNRPPFNLRKIILTYDALQVIINAYLFYMALTTGWSGYYNWLCAPLEWDDTPHHRKIINLCYLYYLIKLTDLLDTVFFVLRKKYSHISFLHLYHHTGMVILGYCNSKWVPGGHHTSIGLINSFVHTFMYAYYFFAQYYNGQVDVSWKKLITKLQIIQFLMITLHLGILLFQPNCTYPKWFLIILLPQNAFMMALFTDFYRKNYLRKPPAKKE